MLAADLNLLGDHNTIRSATEPAAGDTVCGGSAIGGVRRSSSVGQAIYSFDAGSAVELTMFAVFATNVCSSASLRS